MEPPVEVMLTICSNGFAPLNKMATKPIYSKKKKTLFSRTKKALRLKLGIQHRGLKVYQIYLNDDTRMTFDHFTV